MYCVKLHRYVVSTSLLIVKYSKTFGSLTYFIQKAVQFYYSVSRSLTTLLSQSSADIIFYRFKHRVRLESLQGSVSLQDPSSLLLLPRQYDKMRYYEQRYPEVDELVMVQVRQIAEMGAYVKLVCPHSSSSAARTGVPAHQPNQVA